MSHLVDTLANSPAFMAVSQVAGQPVTEPVLEAQAMDAAGNVIGLVLRDVQKSARTLAVETAVAWLRTESDITPRIRKNFIDK